jgi:S1-C subfamily serine protease
VLLLFTQLDITDVPRTEPHHDAVIRVHRGRSVGSGVVLKAGGEDTWILTAAHVLEDSGDVVIRRGLDDLHTARIVRQDKVCDIALLRIKGKLPVVGVDIADEPPPLGAIVECSGYWGGWFRRWDTKVTGRGEKYIYTEPGSISGNSGGAVVYEGKLVGLISAAEHDQFSRHRNNRAPCRLKEFVWPKH